MLLNQVTDKTVPEIPLKYTSKENNLFTMYFKVNFNVLHLNHMKTKLYKIRKKTIIFFPAWCATKHLALQTFSSFIYFIFGGLRSYNTRYVGGDPIETSPNQYETMHLLCSFWSFRVICLMFYTSVFMLNQDSFSYK